MRIVIDMQGAQTESRFRGIGRYTMSIVHAIVRNRGEHEIMLALNGLFPETIEPIRAAFSAVLPQQNIRVWYAPGPLRACEPDNEWRREAAEYVREAFIASLQPDVVYVSSLIEGFVDDAVTSIGVFMPQLPTVVTLYDLIPLLNSETYLTPNSRYAQYYQLKIKYLTRADQWLAISESAAEEGRKNLQLSTSAVTNISAACDSVFHRMAIGEQEKEKFLARFGVTQSFILYSGGGDARKNLKRLIRAYGQLPETTQKTNQLVIAGKISDGDMAEFKQIAKSAGIPNAHIIFTDYITDVELAQLYNLCTVFVMPSVHEGFGLPALEAMACGAAVIGANTTSMPEVVGREDALFDPFDEMAISEKLGQVLGDESFREQLAKHGIEQAKRFTWDDSARRAIAAFERLYANKAVGTTETKGMMNDLINRIATIIPPGTADEEIVKYANALSRINTKAGPHQLFVDISELVQRDAKTGVQRVTRNILQELLKCPPEGWAVEPVYATVESRGYYYARNYKAQLGFGPADLDDEPIDYCTGDVFLGLDLQHHVVNAQKEFLKLVHRDGVKIYFVVYDLLPVKMPWSFMPGADMAHAAWLEVLMGFDGAACISEAVAVELAEWKKIHVPHHGTPYKIGWFHLGADLKNTNPSRGLPVDADNIIRNLSERRTYLMVGTVEPRKGHAQTISAFEILWEQGIDANLVIVGKEGWKVEGLVKKIHLHPELNRRLFWLQGVSDEYLDKIYAVSSCLIAASEGEGFGLPLIEAAKHRLPIIARDIPVFREVAHDSAYYFNGTEPEALAQAIVDWMVLDEKGEAPEVAGMKYLTWSQSADQLKHFLLSADRECSI